MILYSYSGDGLGPHNYRDYGMRWSPLVLATSHYFFAKDAHGKYILDAVDKARILSGIKQIKGANRPGPIILDIEAFDFREDFGFAETQLRGAIGLYRKAFSDRRLCFYCNEMPRRDYWTPINYESQKPPHPKAEQRKQDMLEWTQWNDLFNSDHRSSGERQGPLGLVDLCDMTTMGLYTFYPDQERHRWYMEHNLREARRYNKPIIVWLWTQYHNSNAALQGSYIGDDFLRMQLGIARDFDVEGIVMLDTSNDDCPASSMGVLQEVFSSA